MAEKKKILVIDDEKGFTDMIKAAVEERGDYEVITENKGVAGLAAAREFKPDLIFLDIMISDMDGGTILFNLKNDLATKDIPVIFLTGIMTKREIADKDNVISGHPLLAKPVSIQKLIDCIKETIG